MFCSSFYLNMVSHFVLLFCRVANDFKLFITWIFVLNYVSTVCAILMMCAHVYHFDYPSMDECMEHPELVMEWVLCTIKPIPVSHMKRHGAGKQYDQAQSFM